MLPQEPQALLQLGTQVGNRELLHPVALAALAVLAVAALVVPRRWIVAPMAVLICFIPEGQRLVLAGFDFDFIRLLAIVLWTRLLLRSEILPIGVNHMDRAFLLWVASMMVAGCVLNPTLGGFVNRLGFGFDSLSLYFFFRQAIRTLDDLARVATTFMVLGLPVLLFFLIESSTRHNVFSMFGDVPEVTEARGGRLRCQGAFSHPILAGCFWCSLMPIYALLGCVWRRWKRATTALLVALVLVVLCASSTPVLSLLFGIGTGALYFFRRAMPWFRMLAVGMLVGLHLTMKAPVWALIARIDLAGGSTGYHRFMLIDAAIHRFPEWALVGTPSTAHWGWGLIDVTNHFIFVGVTGGVLSLLLFATVITLGFIGVSRSMRAERLPRRWKYAAWALGCMMFMHCSNFLAVSYFGQILTLWSMTLAATSSLCMVPGSRLARVVQRRRVRRLAAALLPAPA